MSKLTLNPEELAIESFEPAPDPQPAEIFRPRTFEPGCTRDFCRFAED